GSCRDAWLGQRGGLEARLGEFEKQAQRFAHFNPELAEASRQNLKREELRLSQLLAEAETESREKAQQKVELFGGWVRDKESSIANFDRLTITALRRHFADDELERAFRVLNFDLLETAVGSDGVKVKDDTRWREAVRAVAGRVRDGIYEDDTGRIVLRPQLRSVGDLANVERLREELKDHAETLARWQRILNAINEREKLAAQLKQTQADLETLVREIHSHDTFIIARAAQPRLQRAFQRLQQQLQKVEGELADLTTQRAHAEQEQRRAEDAIRAEENAYNQVMGRFGQCVFPEFNIPAVPAAGGPTDFDAAIAF